MFDQTPKFFDVNSEKEKTHLVCCRNEVRGNNASTIAFLDLNGDSMGKAYNKYRELKADE